MMKCKFIGFIFLLFLLFTGCNNINAEKSEETVQAIGLIPVIISSKMTLMESINSEVYHFYDEAVKEEKERYFNKTVNEFSEDDFKTLSEFRCLGIKESLKTLKDIPILFPNVEYLSIILDDFLSKENSDILKNLSDLKAITIHSRPIYDLDFAKNLGYVEISYYQEDCLTEKNNLSSFSVLGKDFINENVKGNPLKFIRVADENYIYELVVTDLMGNTIQTKERKLFISDKNSENIVCNFILDGTDVIGDSAENRIRIYLADANFDGKQDILIYNGQFGNTGNINFTCFLNDGGSYERCESFSYIPNPALDSQNKKILSAWRNWAASHSWAMFTYDGTEYVMTDCVTEEPSNSIENVWQYTIEKRVNNKMQEVEVFTTNDYTIEEIKEKIENGNKCWKSSSDNKKLLSKEIDFGIYGNIDIDSMIFDIINK